MNENDELTQEQLEAAVEAAQAESQPGSLRLVLKRGGQETETLFLFSLPAIIGRFDPSVGPIDVDLGSIPEGSYVSRKHAKIHDLDGAVTLTDLGSSNGTYRLDPDGGDFVKVDSTPLHDGDEIAFGNARFVFRAD